MVITQEYADIWNTLMKQFGNEFGVAGLMGNLFAESSLNPECVTGGGFNTKDKKDAYVNTLKNKQISVDQFAHDGVAFGLVQWRYWSRKEALMIFANERNLPIENASTQLEFLNQEIKTYKTVYNALLNATSVKEASDIVMERYEKPGNISDAAKKKRTEFGQEFYDAFAKKDISPILIKRVETTMPNVNLRCGPGKDFSSITRAKTKGKQYDFLAVADNGWMAISVTVNNQKQALWISPDCAKLLTG